MTILCRAVFSLEKHTMSTQGQVVKYIRGGRRRKDVPDLNIPPVVENAEQAGEPSISVAQSAQGEAPVISIPSGGRNQLERSTPSAPINVEDLDDDVIISSPRAFEEVHFFMLGNTDLL